MSRVGRRRRELVKLAPMLRAPVLLESLRSGGGLCWPTAAVVGRRRGVFSCLRRNGLVYLLQLCALVNDELLLAGPLLSFKGDDMTVHRKKLAPQFALGPDMLGSALCLVS